MEGDQKVQKRRDTIPALESNGAVVHSTKEKANLLTTTKKVQDISNSTHNHEHQEVVHVVENFFATHNRQINEQEKDP